jgi:hypothetical protein
MTNVTLESQQRDVLKSHLRDNLDASHVNRVLADPDVTLEEMRTLSSDEKMKLRQAIQAKRSEIGDAAVSQLEALLKEAETNTSVRTEDATTPTKSEAQTEGPSDITVAWVKALEAVKNSLEPRWEIPTEYLSAWRQLKSVIPGMEVGWLSEMNDVLNQSRQYNKDMINYLVREASSPSLELSFNSWTLPKNRPGWYFNFMPDKFNSVEEKRTAIKNALNNIENLWRDQGSDASGMGFWGWSLAIVAFTFWGYKLASSFAKSVLWKVRWGGAAVAALSAIEWVAGEKAEVVKWVLKWRVERQQAELKARGIIDPTSSDFKELFDVGERTIRGDTSLSDAEKARRINALSSLQWKYTVDYSSGKVNPKYVWNGLKAEVGYIANGQFGAGSIDTRTWARSMVAEAAKNTARNMPGVGRFYQWGLVWALDRADSLKTGASLDPLTILNESIEFKDAPTRNNIEAIWELSKQRAKLLRIQEKMTEVENQKSLVAELKQQLEGTPKTIDLQTESQITTLQWNNNIVNQQPATQIMKRQEINPEYTTTLNEYNKARNTELALTRELTSLNPNKITATALTNEIEARNVAIESKLIDLRTAYPSAQVPDYDRNNKWVNFEKWVLRVAKIFKR